MCESTVLSRLVLLHLHNVIVPSDELSKRRKDLKSLGLIVTKASPQDFDPGLYISRNCILIWCQESHLFCALIAYDGPELVWRPLHRDVTLTCINNELGHSLFELGQQFVDGFIQD